MTNKKKKTKRTKKLKNFLIFRFILLVLFLVICESVVNYLLSNHILPMFMAHLGEQSVLNGLVESDNMAVTIFIFLYLFLLFFFSFLPPIAGNTLIFGLNWIAKKIGIAQPAEEMIRTGLGWQQYLQYAGMSIFFLFCIMLILLPCVLTAMLYSRWVMVLVDKPLNNLTGAMEQVRGGDTTIRVEETSFEEFNQLQDAFNEMTEKMQKNEQERKDLEAKRNLMLSDIAHDLRTPITTVAGYSRALQDGLVTEESKQQEYLEAICRKSMRMDELINLLFEYVQLDSTGFSLKEEQLDVCEIIRENIAMVYADFEEKNITLTIELPEEESEEAQFMRSVDKIQFSRMLSNLVNNALKHTIEGGHILIALAPWENGKKLMVADDAKEVAEELKEHLFEPFVSGDASRNSRGGTGLGLSIAQKIAQMHGFELVLEQPCDAAGYTKSFSVFMP